MKITIVLGPFYSAPPAGFGAVEKVWVDLGRFFAARGHEVTVLARAGGPVGAVAPNLEFRSLMRLRSTGRIYVDLVKDFFYALQAAVLAPKAHVIVSNTFWLPVLLQPLKKWKGRIVVHVARFPKGQMPLYAGADKLHAVSTAVARAIAREHSALAPRIEVIGYPIDIDTFAPAAADEAAPATVLFVGRVHPEKGLGLLIRAFGLVHRHHPSAALSIVGPWRLDAGGGGAAYLEELRAEARGLPVSFGEPIADQDELARIYRTATVFCYPSLAAKGETFGRAVLEAMSSGLPCIVSALDCFRDLIEHRRNGLVFQHGSEAAERDLAQQIMELLGNPATRRELATNARRTAESFALPRVGLRYLDMLERVHQP